MHPNTIMTMSAVIAKLFRNHCFRHESRFLKKSENLCEDDIRVVGKCGCHTLSNLLPAMVGKNFRILASKIGKIAFRKTFKKRTSHFQAKSL